MELSDRLKSLGVRLGNQGLLQPQTQPRDEVKSLWPIEKVISGSDLSTDFGVTFVTHKSFPNEHIHGIFPLSKTSRLDMMAAWAKTPQLSSLDKTEIVFLDTETSGLAGGTGTYAFLIALGFYTPDGFTVAQYFMRDPSQEPALLAAVERCLASFRAMVTFNGKSFDIPLLNTRFLLNKASSPFGNLDHVDLLHLTRRLWRNRLASRALGDLEHEIIRFSRDQDEVPSYLIPQYYFDYLANGDARPLEGVFYHNACDIVSLASLFIYLGDILDQPGTSNLHSLDVVAIARLYEENGNLEEAAYLYEHGLTVGLPEEIYFSTIVRFANLRRKQGQYELAASLWERAARLDNPEACKELSKVLEHNLKRYPEALQWARKGLENLHKRRGQKYLIQLLHEDFEKRIERLEKKVNHG
jgi:uncharacterized protein